MICNVDTCHVVERRDLTCLDKWCHRLLCETLWAGRLSEHRWWFTVYGMRGGDGDWPVPLLE